MSEFEDPIVTNERTKQALNKVAESTQKIYKVVGQENIKVQGYKQGLNNKLKGLNESVKELQKKDKKGKMASAFSKIGFGSDSDDEKEEIKKCQANI